jgi:hypothetical protein
MLVRVGGEQKGIYTFAFFETGMVAGFFGGILKIG